VLKQPQRLRPPLGALVEAPDHGLKSIEEGVGHNVSRSGISSSETVIGAGGVGGVAHRSAPRAPFGHVTVVIEHSPNPYGPHTAVSDKDGTVRDTVLTTRMQ